MRAKRAIIAFLLAVGLCLMPALGYGKIKPPHDFHGMDIILLKAQIGYIMENPTTFLDIDCFYDIAGIMANIIAPDLDLETEGKIFVSVTDTRGVFFGRSRKLLMDEFHYHWEAIYSHLKVIGLAPLDLHTDIAAIFINEKKEILGYFYQGEYYLWYQGEYQLWEE